MGRPSPVGCFPRGCRGCLVDLAGNVLEWCSNAYEERLDPVTLHTKIGTEQGNRARRALRAGYWQIAARALRAATRDRGVPHAVHAVIGLRLVRSVPH